MEECVHVSMFASLCLCLASVCIQVYVCIYGHSYSALRVPYEYPCIKYFIMAEYVIMMSNVFFQTT